MGHVYRHEILFDQFTQEVEVRLRRRGKKPTSISLKPSLLQSSVNMRVFCF